MNPTIFRLGLVSFFADISSEMLYPVTPLFLTLVLGSSMLQVGLIEGFAEGVASLLKTHFGAWSDRIQKRRPFIFLGYLLSAISKPFIGAASSWGMVFCGRGLDRLGKAARTGPRDALLDESVGEHQRGRAFGWHRGMDSAGAVIGPMLALSVTTENIRQYYYWAFVPGLIAALIVLAVKAPQQKKSSDESSVTDLAARPATKMKFGEFWRAQNSTFKKFIWALGVFALVNSSDVFLLLKVKELGYSFKATIGFYCLYNLSYTLLSPIAGRFSDRKSKGGFVENRKHVFATGLFVFALVYSCFSLRQISTIEIVGLFILYGFYAAATDGVGKALTLDFLSSPTAKGTGLGFVGTITGVATIAASSVGGALWDALGSKATFLFGASGALVAMVLIIRLKPKIDIKVPL